MIRFEEKHKDWHGPTTDAEYSAWEKETSEIQEAYIFIAESLILESRRVDVVPPRHIIKTLKETISSLTELLRSYEEGPVKPNVPCLPEGRNEGQSGQTSYEREDWRFLI